MCKFLNRTLIRIGYMNRKGPLTFSCTCKSHVLVTLHCQVRTGCHMHPTAGGTVHMMNGMFSKAVEKACLRS